jgi:hypothetical protein
MYSIGDEVSYYDEHSEKIKCGTISEVSSDLDSYVNLEVNDDIVHYYSKKLRRYVPVKPKNMDTLYFTIPQKVADDFVVVKNILGSSYEKDINND